MNNLRTIKKNAKALSPVVASIILIAVTVAVSVAVAAWMGGMTVGLMGGTEKVAITNMQFDAADSITVTVQNTGDGAVEIKSGFIDGNSATIPVADWVLNDLAMTEGPISLAKGDSAQLTLSTTALTTAHLADGQLYQVKLSTAKGNTMVYTATYNAP